MRSTRLILDTRPFVFNSFLLSTVAILVLFVGTVAGQENSARPIAARLIPSPNSESCRPRRVHTDLRATITTAGDSATIDEANSIERRAFDQTNEARAKNGLAPLSWDSELYRLARAHSESMALKKFFAHETPDGLQLRDRARANQIRFRVIGENIAYNKGYNDPGGYAVERWLISSGHRANILYSGFQAAAIGSYIAADGSTYLTQVFISR